jgi:hypothetical protein
VLSVSFLVFITCKKIDHINDEPSIEKKESDFFTKHASNDPYIQSITDFIRRKNDKEHFVDNWIKKAGYAYWDKSIKSHVSGGAIARVSTDTSTTLFIPFVIDSQVVVKTTLVINTTPSDTNVHFIADWQYKSRPYGSVDADTSAENVALLFMILDRNIFGYDEFKILDSNLFSSLNILPGTNGRTIKFNTISGNQSRLSTAWTYTTCYLSSWFCGSPNYSGCQGGCDFLNCATPPTCYGIYTCWEYEIDDDPITPAVIIVVVMEVVAVLQEVVEVVVGYHLHQNVHRGLKQKFLHFRVVHLGGILFHQSIHKQ